MSLILGVGKVYHGARWPPGSLKSCGREKLFVEIADMQL